MILRLILAVLILGWGVQAWADEDLFEIDEEDEPYVFGEDYDYQQSMIFIGQLESTTLFPRDHAKEREDCEAEAEKTGEKCEIIISTGGGTEIIQFLVLENLYGAKEGETVALKTGLNEWGNYRIKLTKEKMVIWARRFPQESRYADEYEVEGYKIYYHAKDSHYFLLTDSFKFRECQEMTGVDCKSFLRPIEPKYVGRYDEYWDWIKEMEAEGILRWTDENKLYALKGIFLEDLISEIKENKNPEN